MNKQRLLLSAAATAFVAFGVAAPASAETLNVVASFTVLADVVKHVGGDHVKVSSLVGANGDPHEFEPSPADAKTLNAAKVVFVSGEGLEGWMDRLISASGYKGTPVVASEGINTRTMVDDGKTVTDPHVWNSPINVKIWVANIEKALSAADPADAADFKANAERYTKVLTELDTYAHSKFDKIPDDRRKVLTSHDAFGYFGREYKVNFLAPIGFSTETEASAAKVAQLIEQIKTEHVKTYFFENSNDPRLVKQVAKATGAEPGGELYVESLSKANGPASTYEKMFRYNVDQLAAAMAKSS
ncbi:MULTISPECIES: zinc ABC transporter substrate-binding protein [unclassified Rhizobium]|uniref:metal ABC transporter solute-binding protein, Zn/Mn family n=1 Tax=unclassified Rhizobium TaxID=2613769 RepID=UPI000DDFE584|nr:MULTISPECIES: zinc ABC transporter substrate-binding protein [unclassified Rhizobium]MBB3288486.1 zinc/manganese transport system substrate-binding protein [Rhizobium sp. BK252]MBB3403377.1 zinc/manganese transport system substrate-binding protein [Rhizobium sp. BK289]MBB3415952.1 zinc/manganese transport system substrate-binding protein [Rhizobium sp. BK284]MBB3483840.1 zinc/manganese transport system substrate-binding protein [Rhizobium sp. BK347]MDK4722182.1 zinc ABC transporter substrat